MPLDGVVHHDWAVFLLSTITTLPLGLEWGCISPLAFLCGTAHCSPMAGTAGPGFSSVVLLFLILIIFSLSAFISTSPSCVLCPACNPAINSTFDSNIRADPVLIWEVGRLPWWCILIGALKKLLTPLFICTLARYLFVPFSLNFERSRVGFIKLGCNIAGLWRLSKSVLAVAQK